MLGHYFLMKDRRREGHLQGVSRTAARPRGEAVRRWSGKGPGRSVPPSVVRGLMSRVRIVRAAATAAGRKGALPTSCSSSLPISHCPSVPSHGAAVPQGPSTRRRRRLASLTMPRSREAQAARAGVVDDDAR